MRAFPLATLGFFLALTGCADWTPAGSLTSPDGKTIAQIEVSRAGAPADDKTRVIIRNGVGGVLPKPVNVVEAENAIVGQTRLKWTDADHLRVTLCDATAFHVNAENLGDPPYTDDGRSDGVGVPNGVWVEVLNLSYSEATKRCVPQADAG